MEVDGWAWCRSTDEESGDELPDHIAPTDCVDKGPLDALMLGLWDMCNEDGLFRYDVTACSTKVLPGQYGFIAQLNEGRATKKRPTEFRVDQVCALMQSKVSCPCFSTSFECSKLRRQHFCLCLSNLFVL